jgi:hypothetical protein
MTAATFTLYVPDRKKGLSTIPAAAGRVTPAVTVASLVLP